VDTAALIARACRAVGRLVAAGSRPATAAAEPSSGGRDDGAVGAMVVALLAREQAVAAPGGAERPDGGGGGGPAAVAAGLMDLAPRDVSVLAALAIGMLLLAVTAVAAYSLADGQATARRRRSLLHGIRRDPGRRADARAVLVLVVASLVFWSAIALWLLTRAG
jgi:hypothetical protein